MTPDGDHIVFSSVATNVVASDGNGSEDVFVRRRALVQATTIRVSFDNAGNEAPGAIIGDVGISADGRYVAFVTTKRLVTDDVDDTADLYVRDTQEGVTTRLNRIEGASFSAILVDGPIAVFDDFIAVTARGNGLPGGVFDEPTAYRVDMGTGEFSLLIPVTGDEFVSGIGASADGAVIAAVHNRLDIGADDIITSLMLSQDSGQTFTTIAVQSAEVGSLFRATVPPAGGYVVLVATRSGTVNSDFYIVDVEGNATNMTPTPPSGNGAVFNAFCDDLGRTCAFDSTRNDHAGGANDVGLADRDGYLLFPR